ncbi:MAG TPA: tRNA (adenosine(37)-N6)-dimethylallyltransferase MiaA [Coriobacteriia bacterium]|nr:MAG: tRNA dimethylallyltransferase [Actinobacteria bacterium 66_15]HAL29270.1 tRNA (adenosine(37)-N6)-dimethylallyltransferase MiaA [Coriobacteriia bacterium]
MGSPRVVAIVGPTAVGKSAVAESVAVALGGEIVSADSMQIYRGLDIGTAKTPAAERRVRYHCVDLVEPGQPYSAALFQRDARAAIDGILARGSTPVVVGGTGLYVRAALDAMDFPAGETGTPLRAHLEERARAGQGPAMHAELASLDPESAALIHPNNTRRVIRALEMLHEGRPYARQARDFRRRQSHYPDTRYFGLTLDRATLYERIDARVDDMLSKGLLDEIGSLVAAGLGDALTSSQAIGYKELVPVVTGGSDIATAVVRVKQATRRYAKRQLTWFRADPRIEWVDVDGMTALETAQRILHLIESSGAQTQGGST